MQIYFSYLRNFSVSFFFLKVLLLAFTEMSKRKKKNRTKSTSLALFKNWWILNIIPKDNTKQFTFIAQCCRNRTDFWSILQELHDSCDSSSQYWKKIYTLIFDSFPLRPWCYFIPAATILPNIVVQVNLCTRKAWLNVLATLLRSKKHHASLSFHPPHAELESTQVRRECLGSASRGEGEVGAAEVEARRDVLASLLSAEEEVALIVDFTPAPHGRAIKDGVVLGRCGGGSEDEGDCQEDDLVERHDGEY